MKLTISQEIDLVFMCKECGDILDAEVDDTNDEDVLISPCDCIKDEA